MKHRFAKEGLRAAVVFILAVSIVELLAQTFLLFSVFGAPSDLLTASTFLDLWFTGGGVWSGAWFSLVLILLSIIAIALLEMKPDDKVTVV